MTSVPGMRVTFRPSRQKEAWGGGGLGAEGDRGVCPRRPEAWGAGVRFQAWVRPHLHPAELTEAS